MTIKTTNETMQELKKQGFINKLDSTIRTMREAGSPEGPPSPFDFFKQVIAKLAIAPQDVKDVGSLAKEVVTDPLPILKSISKINIGDVLREATISPPKPSTVAAALVPGVLLQTYRHAVPLHARTYLHHVLGIPSKFTYVTGKEKIALAASAQEAIDKSLEYSVNLMKNKSTLARFKLNLREMSDNDILMEYHSRLNYKDKQRIHNMTNKISKVYEDATYFEDKIKYINENFKKVYADKLRRRLYRLEKQHIGLPVGEYQKVLVDEASKTASNEYIKATGNIPKGFYANTSETKDGVQIGRALGKYYVEPTIINKGALNQRIVPKAIHDIYKFYPEVYGFESGDIRRNLLKTAKRLVERQPYKTYRKELIRDLYESKYNEFLRKLAFGKRPTIVDIALMKGNKLNTVDKAALLLGTQAGAKK